MIILKSTIVYNASSSQSGFDTRTRTTTSTATLTPNVSLYDMDVITAQAEALVIANPIGTPVNGNGYVVSIKDNGVAKAITFGDKYVGVGGALISVTTAGKWQDFAFRYNETTDKYHTYPAQVEV